MSPQDNQRNARRWMASILREFQTNNTPRTGAKLAAALGTYGTKLDRYFVRLQSAGLLKSGRHAKYPDRWKVWSATDAGLRADTSGAMPKMECAELPPSVKPPAEEPPKTFDACAVAVALNKWRPVPGALDREELAP